MPLTMNAIQRGQGIQKWGGEGLLRMCKSQREKVSFTNLLRVTYCEFSIDSMPCEMVIQRVWQKFVDALAVSLGDLPSQIET